MTGKTVNIPILEISEQERAEKANLRQKALTRCERLLREAGLVVIESVLPRDLDSGSQRRYGKLYRVTKRKERTAKTRC